MTEKVACLEKRYSTTKLCYKSLDNNYLDERGKIKKDLKFEINIPTLNIQNSKLIGKPEDKFETMLFLPPSESRKGEGGLRTKGYFKFSYRKGIRGKGEGVSSGTKEWWIVDENDNFIKKVNLPEAVLRQLSINDHELTQLPLITVITVVLNGAKYLEETIQSVINQTYPNVEYIIIDGGSIDGTLDIIKKYEDKIDYWVSEKDEGIYDAMNKASKISNGIFVQFLNSGDLYKNTNSLKEFVEKIDDLNKVYFARAEIIGKNTGWIYPSYNRNVLKWQKKYLPNHQAMLFPRSFYKNYIYDLRLKTTGDIDYKLEAKKYGFIFVDIVFVKFKLGGASTKCPAFKELIQKIKEIILRDFIKRKRLTGYVDILKSVSKSIMCHFLSENIFQKSIKLFKRYE